ncbi:MAG: DUF554 domain-containing protein [Saccharofermentanales bacterium]|jgi:uncharacterized membrane protein YqgA involved in biofilm formation|nr:DUF554 domain-containing protein [Clostridiaceae bacterium]
MLGVIVNTIAVIVGSLLGLIFHKAVPERIVKAVMIGIGLCTIYIGISNMLKGENTLILIISLVIGAIIGTLLDIDGAITRVGDSLTRRFGKKGKTSSLTEGFVTASLLFCIGAMTIVGSLNSGLTGDHEMIFTKSLLDLISAIMLSASLGIGVLFSAAFVFVFQGAIVMLATTLQPFLTSHAIAELTCVGSVIILALGLNILGITRLKVANYLPAIIVAPILAQFI